MGPRGSVEDINVDGEAGTVEEMLIDSGADSLGFESEFSCR